MFELLILAGVIVGLFALAGVAKFLFALILLPIRAMFWLLGAALQLILLPFQLIGGLLLAVIAGNCRSRPRRTCTLKVLPRACR